MSPRSSKPRRKMGVPKSQRDLASNFGQGHDVVQSHVVHEAPASISPRPVSHAVVRAAPDQARSVTRPSRYGRLRYAVPAGVVVAGGGGALAYQHSQRKKREAAMSKSLSYVDYFGKSVAAAVDDAATLTGKVMPGTAMAPYKKLPNVRRVLTSTGAKVTGAGVVGLGAGKLLSSRDSDVGKGRHSGALSVGRHAAPPNQALVRTRRVLTSTGAKVTAGAAGTGALVVGARRYAAGRDDEDTSKSLINPYEDLVLEGFGKMRNYIYGEENIAPRLPSGRHVSHANMLVRTRNSSGHGGRATMLGHYMRGSVKKGARSSLTQAWRNASPRTRAAVQTGGIVAATGAGAGGALAASVPGMRRGYQDGESNSKSTRRWMLQPGYKEGHDFHRGYSGGEGSRAEILTSSGYPAGRALRARRGGMETASKSVSRGLRMVRNQPAATKVPKPPITIPEQKVAGGMNRYRRFTPGSMNPDAAARGKRVPR